MPLFLAKIWVPGGFPRSTHYTIPAKAVLAHDAYEAVANPLSSIQEHGDQIVEKRRAFKMNRVGCIGNDGQARIGNGLPKALDL